MKKLLGYEHKIKKYKLMNKILVLLGVIFFMTSIAVKVNITIRALSTERKYTNEELNSKFNQANTLIYDGLIQINEALESYSIEIDRTNNKSDKASIALENEKDKLINSGRFKNIENTKSEIDKQIKDLKSKTEKTSKLELLYEFYNSYLEYYDFLININGSCNEYILKLRNIEQKAIEIGKKINVKT